LGQKAKYPSKFSNTNRFIPQKKISTANMTVGTADAWTIWIAGRTGNY